jgi:hypothetical protein
MTKTDEAETTNGNPVKGRRLTFDQTLLKFVPAGTETPRRKKFDCKLCQFRTAALYQIAKDISSAELAVLARLYELWFTNFKRNPVKLNAGTFQELGFERRRIGSALKRLEKSNQITVERKAGECPRVTLKESLLWQ